MQQLFGTDGIRARMGQSPLTPLELFTLGSAIGAWINMQTPYAQLLLAHDTRHSAYLAKAALMTGLLQYPITIHNAETLPTPALFHQVLQGPYDYGIMITASHNPYHDNGVKVITKKNGKLTETDEREITALYRHNPHPLSYEHLGTERRAPEAVQRYVEALATFFPEQFLKGITLVVDCANGAYSTLAPQLLATFGAQVIPLATNPDGKNINKECGSLHPTHLQEMVVATKAHAGFAFDGDGDRLIAVAHDGSCKDGDELLAFLLHHPAYQQEPAIVGTIMSNEGFALSLKKMNKILHRTPVGDKHVVEKMKDCNALIGGEPSGHLILRDFTATADGLFTLLRIAQAAQLTNDWLFSSFTKLPHILLNVPVLARKDLSESRYAQIIAAQQERLSQGRIIVRYSGTEPVLRIMVEAINLEEARIAGTLLSQQLTDALTKE